MTTKVGDGSSPSNVSQYNEKKILLGPEYQAMKAELSTLFQQLGRVLRENKELRKNLAVFTQQAEEENVPHPLKHKRACKGDTEGSNDVRTERIEQKLENLERRLIEKEGETARWMQQVKDKLNGFMASFATRTK